MIPATLPICVFFTLYAVAAVGFFVAQHAICELADDLRPGDGVKIAVGAVLWPIVAAVLVVVFVRRGARA